MILLPLTYRAVERAIHTRMLEDCVNNERKDIAYFVVYFVGTSLVHITNLCSELSHGNASVLKRETTSVQNGWAINYGIVCGSVRDKVVAAVFNNNLPFSLNFAFKNSEDLCLAR